VIDEKLQGDVVVTVIATGFIPSLKKEKEALPFLRRRPAPASASTIKDHIELPPFMR